MNLPRHRVRTFAVLLPLLAASTAYAQAEGPAPLPVAPAPADSPEADEEEEPPAPDVEPPADAEPAASDITNDLGANTEEPASAAAADLEQLRRLELRYFNDVVPSVDVPVDESRQPLPPRGGGPLLGVHTLATLGTDGLAERVARVRSDASRTAYLEMLKVMRPVVGRPDLRGAPLGPVESDIPIVDNEMVRKWIRFFTGVGQKYYRVWVARYWRYGPLMRRILEAEGLPSDTVYLSMIESGFSPKAYSFAHAAGQWQFIRSTGVRMGLAVNYWVDERRDPIKATYAAAAYLRELYQSMNHWHLAWASYNTGPGRVARAIRRQGSRDFFQIVRSRHLRWETRNYVPKLIAAATIAKDPARFGFGDIDPLPPYEFDELPLSDNLHLDVLARACGTTTDVLADLNPPLRRAMTPPVAPGAPPYLLRVPRHSLETCRAGMDKLEEKDRTRYRRHRVLPTDTLEGVAQKFQTTVDAIVAENSLPNRKARAGEDLLVPVPPGVDVPLGDLEDDVSERRGKVVKAAPPRGTKPTRVVVRKGDTLWDIATAHGVDVRSVVAWNGLNRRRRLRAGQQLIIYLPTKAASGR